MEKNLKTIITENLDDDNKLVYHPTSLKQAQTIKNDGRIYEKSYWLNDKDIATQIAIENHSPEPALIIISKHLLQKLGAVTIDQQVFLIHKNVQIPLYDSNIETIRS